MRVPKKLAIFGFNLCASIFVGFCVYGLLIYIDGESKRHFSTAVWSLMALGVIGCIVGICFFGAQWDLRNVEESRDAAQANASKPVPTSKPKRRK
ncbi:MAG: hypothetical protein Kow00128_00800 [Deltaproteobacteria bacterium]